VAYNGTKPIDALHNISIDFKVTNENDSKEYGMLRRPKPSWDTTIYSDGYDTKAITLEFDYATGSTLLFWLPFQL
jgi:hypothetical protein